MICEKVWPDIFIVILIVISALYLAYLKEQKEIK